MRTKLIAIAMVTAVAASGTALAQKGVGDETGVARWSVKPELVSLSGTVISVDTHPCGKTTGKAPEGTHIILRASDGTEINLHLGPADEVADTASKVTAGDNIRCEAFRTDDLPDDNYVAQSLVVGDEVVTLRDARTLRPVWASRYDRRQGRGQRWWW